MLLAELLTSHHFISLSRAVAKRLKKRGGGGGCPTKSSGNIGMRLPARSNCAFCLHPIDDNIFVCRSPKFFRYYHANISDPFVVDKTPFLHTAVFFATIFCVILYKISRQHRNFCQQLGFSWRGVTLHTPHPRDDPESKTPSQVTSHRLFNIMLNRFLMIIIVVFYRDILDQNPAMFVVQLAVSLSPFST